MVDFSQAISAIQASNNILILPSTPPDGDSIGGALAMYMGLKSLGKNATVVLSSEVPDIYRFLPNANDIRKEAELNPDFMIKIDLREGTELKDLKHEVVDNKINIIVTPKGGNIEKSQVTFPEQTPKYDLIITVDTAELSQLGSFGKENMYIFGQIPSVNIDHHATNANYASVNVVDPNASSATQMLVELFAKLEISITPDIATLLLAGIITDTGSFQNANTTPESFDIAAELVEQGARQQEIIKNVYKTKHLETLKLWGRILSNIQVDEQNKIVWSSVSRQDFKETGTEYEDVGDIIDDLISNAEEAEVALLMVEKEDGSLHGSIRTNTDEREASKMASEFGGGGHLRAAGFTIENAKIEDYKVAILETIRKSGGEGDVAGTKIEAGESKPVAGSQVEESVKAESQEPITQTPTQPQPTPKTSQVQTPMQAQPESTQPQPGPTQQQTQPEPGQQKETVQLETKEEGTISGGSPFGKEQSPQQDPSVNDLSRKFTSGGDTSGDNN